MVHVSPMTTKITHNDRVEGGLLGLLVGDALGVPYEFAPPHHIPAPGLIEFTPPSDWSLTHKGVLPGTWSDDGAQALVLLESLQRCDGLNLTDFAVHLLKWRDEGHMAVGRHVFDWGIQTEKALEDLRAGRPPETSGRSGERDNGNGSLMRVLPLALWHRGEDRALMADAMRSSLPTHGHLRSQLCCAVYCLWARHMLAGATLNDGWKAAVAGLHSFAEKLDGDTDHELQVLDLRREPSGSGTGYVLDCLHSARLALSRGSSYEEVVKAAILLGNDTDTTAAVAGGIAGIVYGVTTFPQRWLSELRGRELFDPLLKALLA